MSSYVESSVYADHLSILPIPLFLLLVDELVGSTFFRGLQITEFRAEPQNLSVAIEFPCVCGILWNCLFTCHKSTFNDNSLNHNCCCDWQSFHRQVQIDFSDFCLLSSIVTSCHLLSYFISHFE